MSTILITGANGSLAIPAVEYLLGAYPSLTVILTARDVSNEDRNTAELRRVIAKFPDAAVSVRKLDLNSLEEVQSFSEGLNKEVHDGKVPRLLAVLCNAMSWKLSGGPAYSKDGFEKTIAINHLAQFALSLRLLQSMDTEHGRIVFLGSVAHWPDKSALSKGFPTKLPERLDWLVHPLSDEAGEEMGRGMQRYGTSKLVVLMVMYELNRRMKMRKDTKSIRAITVDPLDLLNSKAFFQPHMPMRLRIMFTILGWFIPLMSLLQPRISTVERAAPPVVDVAVANEFAGQEGYFEARKKTESSPDSMDEKMQKALWNESVAWCGLKREDTVVDL